ncbi:hypothetical protein ACIBKY_50005 [Nonomuraea sp. NPDC050394]|uniref:hypothetical protein n=1 Tax=Nonomuraea sp. NPDC050394 TaxID=3364363 RepID=UPI0037B2D733
MSGRVRTLLGALSIIAATLALTPAVASADGVLHRNVYSYAHGYKVNLTIFGNAGQARGMCTITNLPESMIIRACQLLRSTSGGAGTESGNGWQRHFPRAYSRMLALACGTSYRVFIRFQAVSASAPSTAYGTWWRPC